MARHKWNRLKTMRKCATCGVKVKRVKHVPTLGRYAGVRVEKDAWSNDGGKTWNDGQIPACDS